MAIIMSKTQNLLQYDVSANIILNHLVLTPLTIQ